jgi:hypothetical protein
MPIIRGLVPKKIKPRVDFDIGSFRQRVYEKGLYMTWEMAGECPCNTVVTVGDGGSVYGRQNRSADTGEPRVDCPSCNGTGLIYHSSQTVRGLVIGAENDFDRFRLYGEYATGMVGITLLPEHVPGILDRFTIMDSLIVFKETRKRTTAVVEELRYAIGTRSVIVGTEADQTESETQELSALYAIKATTNGVISGNELVIGTDFTITSSGKIDWTLGIAAGTAPTEGEYYAFTYFAHPRYVVANHPHVLRDTRTKRKTASEQVTHLPVKVDCLLEFLRDRDT